MDIKLSNVVAIVNESYSDAVMTIAKECGARGGTVISAQGSVSLDAHRLYGIEIHPEKEIVLILVNDEIKEKILDNLYVSLGLASEAQGIFFTLPVSYASENLIKQYSKEVKEDEE